MVEPPAREQEPIAQWLDRERLLGWLREQRWFASKSQTLTGLEPIEEVAIDDQLTLAIVQVQFATGAHELYQLLLTHDESDYSIDVFTETQHAGRLLATIDASRELDGRHGRFYFRHVVAEPGAAAGASGTAQDPATEVVRPMGAEQTNSSVVLGERIALKLFRRLEPGINPELEMLRFLTARGYPNIPPLHGWYEYEGETLAATLAVAQRFVPGGTDGWELALAEIPAAPERLLERLASLGTATAQLHSALASDPGDPAFSPEQHGNEFFSLLRATLDDQLERVFGQLPDDPRVAPIAGLEQEVRELIALPAQGPVGGRRIRIHGDYHLGQTLHTDGGWVLLDFEGEPARPLNARRAKRSALRDVAGMLRSFSYATWAVRLQRGLEPPEGFERRARTAFLDAYLAAIDPVLLPTGEAQIANLLATFELEKALYELQYELDNRPDWLPIPVAGILRLLGAESG